MFEKRKLAAYGYAIRTCSTASTRNFESSDRAILSIADGVYPYTGASKIANQSSIDFFSKISIDELIRNPTAASESFIRYIREKMEEAPFFIGRNLEVWISSLSIVMLTNEYVFTFSLGNNIIMTLSDDGLYKLFPGDKVPNPDTYTIATLFEAGTTSYTITLEKKRDAFYILASASAVSLLDEKDSTCKELRDVFGLYSKKEASDLLHDWACTLCLKDGCQMIGMIGKLPSNDILHFPPLKQIFILGRAHFPLDKKKQKKRLNQFLSIYATCEKPASMNEIQKRLHLKKKCCRVLVNQLRFANVIKKLPSGMYIQSQFT